MGLGDYKLVVEGNSYGRLHGSLFLHEQSLRLTRQKVRIVLQTEKEVYAQGQIGQCSSILQLLTLFLCISPTHTYTSAILFLLL